MRVGEGEWTYEPVERWGALPPGWSFREIGAVGTDRQDNVYVFNRGEHPMIVFDRDGKFLRSWGEGVFPRAHGLHMGPDDTVWLTDDADHTVRQCRLGRDRAAHARHPWAPGAVYERRAVPPLHAHRAVARGRPLRGGWVRQRRGA